MFVTALLLGLVGVFCILDSRILGRMNFERPLITCTIVGVLLGDLRCGSGAAGAVAVERGKREASVYLYRAVYPGLFHGRPAVPGHVRPVPAGGGAERGSGPDHLRERGRAWGSW